MARCGIDLNLEGDKWEVEWGEGGGCISNRKVEEISVLMGSPLLPLFYCTARKKLRNENSEVRHREN